MAVRAKLQANYATLSFMLCNAWEKTFRDTRPLKIEYGLGDGYFCQSNWEPVSASDLKKVENIMREEIEDDETQIQLEYVRSTKCQERFKNQPATLAILKVFHMAPVPIMRHGDYWDLRLEHVHLNKGTLVPFELRPYEEGFLLRFPTLKNPKEMGKFKPRPQLLNIFKEHQGWGAIMGCTFAGDLNTAIHQRDAVKELVLVSEGLHEKKLAYVVEGLIANWPKKRIISIAGPSSSGKTTFAKRLGIQLRVAGWTFQYLGLDDYFKDRNDIPFEEDGTQDFEHIRCLNINLLVERLEKLLKGEAVPKRHFDFLKGIGIDSKDEVLKLRGNDFIIMEGIHGLNPAFTSVLGDDKINRIFVSPITHLSIDEHHRVSTSDLRLIRRIVRDYKFRGYTPERTIERWESVRRGEEKNIFPFQEMADFTFNSALIYELPVLAYQARCLLAEVTGESWVVREAERLMMLLNLFYALSEDIVPGNSLLREFVGKSDLADYDGGHGIESKLTTQEFFSALLADKYRKAEADGAHHGQTAQSVISVPEMKQRKTRLPSDMGPAELVEMASSDPDVLQISVAKQTERKTKRPRTSK